MSAPRTVDVDGRTYTFTLNTPFASMLVTDGDDTRVVPTGGETRFSNQQLRKIVRELLATS